MKTVRHLFVVALGVAFLTGAAAKPPRPLVIAVSTEPSTLDGQAVIDRNSRVASGNIFESLLDRGANGQVIPWLAESYKAVNDTTWRFNLKKNVKFHNGEPFNAEAAVFSVNRITDKAYKTQRASYIENIKGAQAVDEFTLDVMTDGANAVLPVQMTQLVMVPPKAAKEKNFGVAPIGTGPYKFVRWDRGREVLLTVNENYWREKPTIKEFAVRVIPDPQTQISALQAGEIDLVLDLLPEQAKLAPRFISMPATEFSYIQFNAHKKELADPRVRIALNLAIDKATLAKTMYQGHGRPMDAQHLAKGMLGYNAQLKPYPYDPKRARQLLKEAGYPDGFEIVLHAPIGRYLKGEETSEFVAAQLKEVGIKAKIQLHEWNAYRKLGRIPGKETNAFDLKYGWNSNEWFDASRIVSHITCDGTSSKLCDKKIDELMDKAIQTLDQKARDKLYQEVWAMLNKNPHAIYLLQQNLIYGLSKRLDWQPRLDDEVRVAAMRASE
ncbi:MAG: transporter substrate-binding protein [Deltaproteobacteria bacterium]|nr:transporter substrate-binding protein [Deltaproteobacteria bacterium]